MAFVQAHGAMDNPKGIVTASYVPPLMVNTW